MNHNLLTILLTHNRWANRNILDACALLTEDQLHRRFEMGPGSLHDTLLHTIFAMGAWADVLSNRPVRPRPDGERFPINQLRAMHEALCDELDRLAAARPLDETVSRTRDGTTYNYTRAVALTHVTTHGIHHRAQCLNMLRHMDIAPLPKSSIAEWSLETAAVPA